MNDHPFADGIAGGAILLLLAFAQETASKASSALQNRFGLAHRAALAFRAADEYCESGWTKNAPVIYEMIEPLDMLQPLDLCSNAGPKPHE